MRTFWHILWLVLMIAPGWAQEQLAAVDLRPQFAQFGLEPRKQGARPTCSVFTVTGALEFALAKQTGDCPRLSVEFLNWAANRACGDQADGGFFSDLWKGFSAYGICTEAEMPYQRALDPNLHPSEAVLSAAKGRLSADLRLHWIKEWDVKTGLTDRQIYDIKSTLQRGWPVCGGFRWPKHQQWVHGVLQMCPPEDVYDGHSVLIVGFRQVNEQPGGGVLVFRNTSGGKDGEMPFAYAAKYMNDAVWIESGSHRPPQPPKG